MRTVTPEQIRAADKTLAAGTWAITAGAVLYSVLTVTPLVQRVTPDAWDWTGPILPLVVDAAVVIVVRLDSVVSRLGASGGKWPALLRWMTGLMTLLLNIGNSALAGDLVGVAVHAVAPGLLIVTAEAGLAYRRAIARGLDRIAAEQAAERERSRAEREAREQAARAERERERERRERSEREAREHAERLAREQAERERETAREEREHAARMERERAERAAAEKAAEQERIDARAERERRERAEREAREHQQRERERAARQAQIQQRQARRELTAAPAMNTSVNAGVNTRSGSVNTPVTAASDKVSEAVARAVIADPMNAGRSVRQLADETGWSIGWVSARRAEQRHGDEDDAAEVA